MKKIVLVISFLFVLIGCAMNYAENENKSEVESKTVVLKKLWTSDSTLKVPESVIYNWSDGYLYVSNINGKPDSADGNGFITRMGIDGSIKKLEWCKGLNAPKGMGIFRGKLYVTDITSLVIIDIVTATIEKKIEIPGTRFLNDITIDGMGNVFITDSYNPSIYVYSMGSINLWKGKGELIQPNGLLEYNGMLYLADMGSGKFYRTALPDTNFKEVAKIPFGDGVNRINDSTFIISSWPGEIYIAQGRLVTKILDTKEIKHNAADAWYIKERNLYFVPTFFANTVIAYSLEME